MVNFKKLLGRNAATLAWKGALTGSDRFDICDHYGVTLSDNAWADLEYAMYSYATALGLRQGSARKADAEGKVETVLSAAHALISAIKKADTNNQVYALGSGASVELALLRKITSRRTDANLSNVMFSSEKSIKNSPQASADDEVFSHTSFFFELLEEYTTAIEYVLDDLMREPPVSTPGAELEFIRKMLVWAKKHGYPAGVSNRPTSGKFSSFVLLMQFLNSQVPRRLGLMTISDQSMADKIIHARKTANAPLEK